MMRKVVSLTAFLMLAVLSCLTAPAAHAQDTPQPYLKKTIERDENVPNLYNATIETFVEGNTSYPIDVMLVFDTTSAASDAKAKNYYPVAFDNFINAFADYNGDVQFSVITFNNNAFVETDFVDAKKTDISTIKGILSTNGKDYSKEQKDKNRYSAINRNFANCFSTIKTTFEAHNSSAKAKYIILITPYYPNPNGTGSTESERYNDSKSAWENAYELKDKGIMIYTVYYGTNGNYTKSYQLSSAPKNIMTFDNFLKAVSSNYPKAYANSATDKNYISSSWTDKGGTSAPSTSDAYHFKTSNNSIGSTLTTIKTKIVDDAKTKPVITPSISLTSPSVVDKLATGFKLPNGALATCTVAPCKGKAGGEYIWGSETVAAGVTASAEYSTVTVSGFNFNDNCVYSDGSSTHVGQKLIVKYPFIIDTSKKTSGNDIETTEKSSSGIFDGESKFDFDLSGAKTDLRTITVKVTGLREGDNAVVNLTNSKNETLRYVVVGDKSGPVTIDVTFQRKGTYTASLELSKIYTEQSEKTTQKEDGDETLVFNCTRSTSVSHAVKHKKYEFR